jgi:hypothetical protein
VNTVRLPLTADRHGLARSASTETLFQHGFIDLRLPKTALRAGFSAGQRDSPRRRDQFDRLAAGAQTVTIACAPESIRPPEIH